HLFTDTRLYRIVFGACIRQVKNRGLKKRNAVFHRNCAGFTGRRLSEPVSESGFIRNHLRRLPAPHLYGAHLQNEDDQGQRGCRSGKKEFKPLIGISASFLIGISAGLFGIGGGALMTPLMIIVLNFSPHVAVATSMVIIFSSSLSSSAGHFAQGNILWGYGAVLIVATYIGSKIGVRINQALDSHSLSQVLRFGLLILGIYMIIDGLM